MTRIIAIALALGLIGSTAWAQTQCYHYNGKMVCCTRIGNQTFCH